MGTVGGYLEYRGGCSVHLHLHLQRKLTKCQKSTSETRDQRKTEGDKKQKKNFRRRCQFHRQNLRDSRSKINYLIEKVMYKALIGLTGGTRISLAHISLFTYTIES